MILHLISGALLLLIPMGALYYLDKALLRSFGVAVGRMVVQLLVLCLMVWTLEYYDSVWLNLFWLVLLSVVSAVFVFRRVELPLSKFLLPVAAGLFCGALSVGMYLLFGALTVKEGLGARWFAPMMALLVGHSMDAVIRGLSTYHSALKTDELQYEFLRGNGTKHLRAVMPFVRRALQAVIAPSVANLSVMGLYAMPLLLCGIFFGGQSPINAFVLTVLLVIGCLASSVIALMVTLWLADKQLFDKFGKLRI